MAYFPMFVELKEELIVVIGGGRVAYRKVEALLEFEAKITVIALDYCDELKDLMNKVSLKQKAYEKVDILDAYLVIAATNNKELNCEISAECRAMKIPVNVVDVQKECSFIFPAYIKRGPITIGITSSGNSPVIAQMIKKSVKEVVPDYYVELTNSLGKLRDIVKKRVFTEKERKKVYQKLIKIGEINQGRIRIEDLDMILEENKNMDRIIRIGTRKSELAMAQTDYIIKELLRIEPSLIIEKIPMSTKGDKILNQTLQSFGGKGAFISEFEDAMLKGEIDIAVHSAKDMPAELPEGLAILALSKREDAADVLVTKKEVDIHKVLCGGIIGTCSLRRKLLIEKQYPVTVKNLRGNVQTRLKKLENNEYDAIILAAAGLKRLNLLEDPHYDFTFLDTDVFTPAGGQGIIAVEGRSEEELMELLNKISDKNSKYCLETEREVLKQLNAGCNEPIGVYANIELDKMNLSIVYEYRSKCYQAKGSKGIEDRIKLATELVEQLNKEIKEDEEVSSKD